MGYMEKLRCDAPDTVPYTEALALKSGTTLNRLAPRVTAASDSAVSAATIKSYQEKIAVLEQEREHSVLECQLLQMRVQALERADESSGGRGSGRGMPFNNGTLEGADDTGTCPTLLPRHLQPGVRYIRLYVSFMPYYRCAGFS